MTARGRYSDAIWSTSKWEPPADYDAAQDNWHPQAPNRHRFSRLGHHHHHPLPSAFSISRGDDAYDDDDEWTSDENGDDSKGNPKTFRRVCERFAERTSMQGIPYVYVSSALHARVFWAAIFLVGLGMMSGHLYLLIDEYYEYKTQTQVDLGFSPLRFPAVTVCNVNRMRKSRLGLASTELREFIAEIQPSNVVATMEDYRSKSAASESHGSGDGEPPPGTSTNDGSGSESGGTKPDQQAPSSSSSSSSSGIGGKKRRKKRTATNGIEPDGRTRRKKRFVNGFEVNGTTSSRSGQSDVEKSLDTYFTNKTVIRQIEEEVEFLYSIQERSNRVDMGHQIEDMLISCSFAGYECYAESFELFQSADYGNCYTIQNSQFTSISGGPSDGLELTLYLDESDYVEGVTTSRAGVQVLVHEPDTWPFPYRRGFAVPAAMETYVALRQVSLQRASQPYGSCQKEDPTLKGAGIKYTRTACQTLCTQQAVQSTCGCFDASEEEINLKFFANITLQFCTNETELQCILQVKSDFIKGILTCSCESACSETEYTKTQSSRAWPSQEYAAILAEYLCEMNASTCDSFKSLAADELSENFLKLVIYFEDLNYENITEEPDYPETQFISDVGGTVGLWIGLSVISIFEVIQFLYEVCHYLLYIKPQQQKKQGRSSGNGGRQTRRKPDAESSKHPSTMSSTLSVGFPAAGALKAPRTLDSQSRHKYLTKI